MIGDPTKMNIIKEIIPNNVLLKINAKIIINEIIKMLIKGIIKIFETKKNKLHLIGSFKINKIIVFKKKDVNNIKKLIPKIKINLEKNNLVLLMGKERKMKSILFIFVSENIRLIKIISKINKNIIGIIEINIELLIRLLDIKNKTIKVIGWDSNNKNENIQIAILFLIKKK